MQDIFDRISPKRDIFDRVAKPQDIFDRLAPEEPALTPEVSTRIRYEAVLPDEPVSYRAAFARGVVAGPASLPKNIAVAAKGLQTAVEGEARPLEEFATHKAGRFLEESAEERFPLPKYREMTFGEQLSYGFGQTLGFMAGGVAGRALKIGTVAVPLLFGQSAVDLFEQAEKAGKSEQDKYKTWLLGLGLDATEAIPITKTLDRVNEATGGGFTRFVKKVATGGVEEAAQEFIQAGGQRKIDREVIGEGLQPGESAAREYFGPEAVQSAELGGIIGTTLNALGMAVGLPSANRARRTQLRAQLKERLATIEQQLPKIEQPTAAPAAPVAGPDVVAPSQARDVQPAPRTPPPSAPAQTQIAGVEDFTKQAKLADDKAKLDTAIKTPAGQFAVKGPLFQAGKQLDLGAPKVISPVDPAAMRKKRVESYYDPDTIEHEIASRGGMRLDLTKEEHKRMLLQNPGAKKDVTSFSRFDPLYSKDAMMGPDQWYEALKGEGKIPQDWDYSDFEAALTDRQRTTFEGTKYRGYKTLAADFDPGMDWPDTYDDYLKRISRELEEQGVSAEKINEHIQRVREERFLSAKFGDLVPSLKKKIEPQGRTQMLRDLSEKLNVPFRTGRFRERAFGIYKQSAEVIRSRIADDISNISHEVGHHLHKIMYGPKLEVGPLKAFADELLELGRPTAGKNPKPPTLLREGLANFVRMYLTEPVTAKETAPRFYADFEGRLTQDPDLNDVLQEFRTKMKLYAEMPALAKVDSMISTDPERPASTNRWQKFYASMVDRFQPLQEAVELMEAHGGEVNTDQNAYKLARLFAGWVGKANHFLEFGTFAPKRLGVTGPGLKQILTPVADDLDNFRRFLVITRAAEKGKQKIETGIDAETAREAARQLEESAGKEKIQQYARIARELYDYQSRLLDYLESAGILDSDLREKFENANLFYVPFFRVMEETPGIGARGQLGNLWQPVKRMKGSKTQIIDPLESIIKNTYAFVNLAERNLVMQALVRQARKSEGMGWLMEDVSKKIVPTTFRLGEIKKDIEAILYRELEAVGFPVGPGSKLLSDTDLNRVLRIFRPEAYVPKGENIVSVFEDGKTKFYQLHPDLYKTVQGLTEQEADLLIRIVSAPSRLLRLGATSLSPEFGIRNPIRDAMTAFAQSKTGFIPGIDSVGGLFHVLKRDEMYQEWLRAGGQHAALVSLDRTAMKQNLKDLLASRGEWIWMHPIEAMRAFSEATEAMTRVGEYARARRQGAKPREAAFGSREVTLDFARMGGHGRILNMLTAFWNAAVQGTDKFVRVHRESPKKAFLKGSMFTVIGLLSYMANRDDEEYHDLPRWLKDWAWLIPTRGTPLEKYTRWIPIPKPFLWGFLYSTVPERAAEWIDQKDPAAFDDLAKEFFEQVSPGFIPTALRPLIEAYANRNIFTNRPLVPQSMKYVDPTHQAHPYTSLWAKETAKALDKTGIKVSPIVLDNTLYGYTGGLGRSLTRAADMLAQEDEPAPKMADIPVLRAFAVRHPSTGTESVRKFYDRLEELETKNATERFAKQNGVSLDSDERLGPREHWELARLRKISRQMANVRKEINVVRRLKLSPAQKRQRIDALEVEIVRLARGAPVKK